MKNRFIELGREAADNVMNKQADIQESVAKIAKREGLNDEQIARLCAQTNHTITVSNHKSARTDDKTAYQNWEVADVDKVKSIIFPNSKVASESTVNYGAYNNSPQINLKKEEISKVASNSESELTFKLRIFDKLASLISDCDKFVSLKTSQLNKIADFQYMKNIGYEQLFSGFLRLIEDRINDGHDVDQIKLYVQNTMDIDPDYFDAFWSEVMVGLQQKGLISPPEELGERIEQTDALVGATDPKIDPEVFMNSQKIAGVLTVLDKCAAEMNEINKEKVYIEFSQDILKHASERKEAGATYSEVYNEALELFEKVGSNLAIPKEIKDTSNKVNSKASKSLKGVAGDVIKNNKMSTGFFALNALSPTMNLLSSRSVYGI